jgi:signal transduction histidine kinase
LELQIFMGSFTDPVSRQRATSLNAQLSQNPYSRLIALVMVGVTLSVLIVIVVLVILQQTLVRHSGETMALEAAHLASRLDRVLYERAGDAQMMAHAFVNRLNDPKYLSGYLAWMVKEYPPYRWLAVLDSQGTIIATTASEWLSQTRSSADWFRREVETANGIVFDAQVYPESNGHVAVGFAVPIRGGPEDQVQGYVASFVSLALLEQSYLGVSQYVQGLEESVPTEYIVVNRDGIALIDSVAHEGQVNLAGLLSVHALRDRTHPGFVKERRLRDGTDVVTGYARTRGYGDVPDFGWGILVRAEHARIVGAISRLTRLVALGGLTAFTVLLGLLFTIMVRLRKEMDKVRQSHEDVEIQVAERTQKVVEKQEQLIQTAKLASLGQLSAGVAHELNNPLNNIKLLVLNALDQVDEGLNGRQVQQPLHKNLKIVAAQVERASSIVQNLRTFARDSGMKKGPVVLGEAIHSAAALLAETFRMGEIELSVESADSKTEVWGNRLQLEQVLVNLLMNASDALKGAVVKRINITVKTDGDWEVVIVTDTGHGIPAEILSHIFDPFYTTKEVGVGTGLGLSIVYGIMKDHGGLISAQSQPGKGASFELRFPTNKVLKSVPHLEVAASI